MSLSEQMYYDNFDDAALIEEHPSVKDARARLMQAGVGSLGGDLMPVEFESAASLFSREFPATPWLVRGLITRSAVYAVAGEPKTSKTWAMLEIAMAVATGTKAFGEFQTIDAQPVLYYAVEDSPKSLRNRLRSLAQSRGMEPAEACRLIQFRSLQALSLTNSHDLARLVAGIEMMQPRPALVALDPLRDLHAEEENDSTAMAKVTHALRALRNVTGCAVAFVHHSTKMSEATKTRRPGQRMRGSSVIHGAVDGGLYLYDLRQDDENVWKNTAFGEVKGARMAGEFSLTLTVEDDDEGEAIEARWEVARGGKRGDEARSSVLAALRAQPAGDWVSVDRIRAACGQRKTVITSALYDLQREGLAERSAPKSGPRSGWRAIGKAIRSDRSHLFPEQT